VSSLSSTSTSTLSPSPSSSSLSISILSSSSSLQTNALHHDAWIANIYTSNTGRRHLSTSGTNTRVGDIASTRPTSRLPRGNFSSAAISDTDEIEGAVTSRLNQLVSKGEVHPDDHQFDAAEELDRIYEYLMTHDPPPFIPTPTTTTTTTTTTTQTPKESKSFFASLFGSKLSTNSTVSTTKTITQHLSSILSLSPENKGAYMFGGVGCGKTFLMNLFYDAVDSGPWAQDKQKVHFHKFMLQVHQHMHEQRKIQGSNGDLIAPVVDQILKQGRLLCLDEFQVTDVADALILQRLFEGLWSKGCILIATSNRPPSDLYLHGLQRDRFLPFIARLEQQCTVVDLLDSETDYRMLAKSSHGTSTTMDGTTLDDPIVYFLSGDSMSHKQFRKLFYKLAEGHPTNPTTLTTQGRNVPIPLSCSHKRIAYFEFADLCQKAMGAADYLVIANNFSTVFCHNVPKLTINELNWLRRFITFVDTMYELKVTLILHTAQPIDTIQDMFSVEGDKQSYSQDEVFAFDRTLSRLEEMSSPKYLKSQWLGGSKRRRAQEKALYQSSTSWISTHPPIPNEEKVTSTLSLHPSLDNHHQELSLAETSHLEDRAKQVTTRT